MGDGLVPKQTKHTPSSPWFISARQQCTAKVEELRGASELNPSTY
jgi:hypothetical protein